MIFFVLKPTFYVISDIPHVILCEKIVGNSVKTVFVLENTFYQFPFKY